MSWQSYIVPRVVYKTSSPYNRDIRVIEEQGKYKFLVNGARESGEYIKGMWRSALAAFNVIPSPDVKRMLFLGVAGGTVIHLLHSTYPDAAITAVDIDPVMLNIGKKYFGLAEIPNATFIASDAEKFMRTARDYWDLIVIDLYIGAAIPPFVSDEQFLQNVRARLTTHGQVLINYSNDLEYETLSGHMASQLKKVFGAVRDTRVQFNRFFMVK